MEFKCLNKKCVDFNKTEFIYKVTFRYEETGVETCQQAVCPKCGVIRHSPQEDIPLSEKNITHLKIPSMSREQKTKVLKERSHKHFVKEIRDRKEGLMGQAINEMRSKGK